MARKHLEAIPTHRKIGVTANRFAVRHRGNLTLSRVRNYGDLGRSVLPESSKTSDR